VHTIHTAKEWDETANIKYATIAIFFSVEDYDRSISQGQN